MGVGVGSGCGGGGNSETSTTMTSVARGEVVPHRGRSGDRVDW